MDKELIRQEIRELSKEIEKHNYLYHFQDNPEISDQEFDLKAKRLEELEKNSLMGHFLFRLYVMLEGV